MQIAAAETGYRIWGVDNVIYGPVEMPTLVSWIKEQRVTSDTWIYSERDAGWNRAAKIPDFQLFFKGKRPESAPAAGVRRRGGFRGGRCAMEARRPTPGPGPE